MSQLDPNHRDAIRAIVLQEAAMPSARPKLRVAITLAVAAALVGTGGIAYAVTTANGGGTTSAHPAATVSPRPGVSPTSSPATPGETGNGSTPIGPAAALVLHGASLDVTDAHGTLVTQIQFSSGAAATVDALTHVLGDPEVVNEVLSCAAVPQILPTDTVDIYSWSNGHGLDLFANTRVPSHFYVKFSAASVNGIALTAPNGGTVGEPWSAAPPIAGAKTEQEGNSGSLVWYELSPAPSGSAAVGVLVDNDSAGRVRSLTSPFAYFDPGHLIEDYC